MQFRNALVRLIFRVPRTLFGGIQPVQVEISFRLDEAGDCDARVQRQGLSRVLNGALVSLGLQFQSGKTYIWRYVLGVVCDRLRIRLVSLFRFVGGPIDRS